MSALDLALPLLRCPVCHGDLAREDRTLRCARRHAFDVARQGYVSLLAGDHRHVGDTAPMVAARHEFLEAGHYAPIAAAVADAVAGFAPPGAVVDLAAGTGYYAAAVLDAEPDRTGVAVDISTPATRRAARTHPNLAAVAADAWSTLPLHDATVAALLSVFGPRTPAELARVLAPGGVAVVVTPAPAHLAEVVGPLGMLDVEPGKAARLRAAFAGFDLRDGRAVGFTMALDHAALAALVGMGPTGHHLDPATIAARVDTLPAAVAVTAAVEVRVFSRPT